MLALAIPSGTTKSDEAAFVRDLATRHFPSRFTQDLHPFIGQWERAEGACSAFLYMPLLERAVALGLVDIQVELCRRVIAAAEPVPYFRRLLADLLVAQGRSDVATDVLANLPEESFAEPGERELALMAQVSDRQMIATLASDLGTILLRDPHWRPERHGALLNRMIANGDEQGARSFFTAWAAKHQVTLDIAWNVGVAALTVGDVPSAYACFQPFWIGQNSESDPLLGRFDGTAKGYDQAFESQLVGKIDAALNEDPPAPYRPHGTEGPLKDLVGHKVLFVGFEPKTFPHDVANHFGQSAQDAGLDFRAYLDTALADTSNFQGTDVDVTRRLSRLEEVVRTWSPECLILELQSGLSLRGLNPSTVATLKAQFGFKLICVFGDAHISALTLFRQWHQVADTVLVFDPLSPFINEERLAGVEHKVLALPVPSNHKPFEPAPKKQDVILFLGATAWQPRMALLALLKQHCPQLTAIFGHQRLSQTRTTESFAQRLAGAHAVLNVSRHGPGVHLITGRVFETMASGSLLVEQDNPATAVYFKPYRHYLPWRDPGDILRLANFVERRPEIAARVAQEAHNFSTAHYSSGWFWSTLLGHVVRERTGGVRVQGWPDPENWEPLITPPIAARLGSLRTEIERLAQLHASGQWRKA